MKKKHGWDFTYVVLILLIALGIYSAMHHPLKYEVVNSSKLPDHVQQGLRESPSHEAFSTYHHGDHTYIVYHLNEPNSYSTLHLKAHKRLSQPIITATINHAVDDPLVESEKAIKLKGLSKKELEFQVVDKR
ncbi:hypothetical protein DVB69_09015 [Sporosarcina sp. BI001-red]|uniref:hypothetical protein n=1 Tax=Sporosarcina sp. BI001-red TaxID=2282866 RepID=UPI000E2602AC|nr:hypothetical protein [Sporosarcina sp. BI001-red]REB08098.1 hypothetical protein DVB69_09015 [Sporosarcina sp. BI001-red]